MILPCLLLWNCSTSQVDAFLPPSRASTSQLGFVKEKADSILHYAINGDNEEDGRFLSENLVRSLDLKPLLEDVSLHAGTRRGRQSFLALVNADYEEPIKNHSNKKDEKETMSSKGRRLQKSIQSSSRKKSSPPTNIKRQYPPFFARTAEEATQEYALVSEAFNLLLEQSTNVSFPPLYGPDSSPYDRTAVETDYDTWLDLPTEEWTLEYILQAEQVIKTVQKVKQWSAKEEVLQMTPSLAAIGEEIEYETLQAVLDVIEDTIKIKRVRTALDPSGRKSFSFQLNGDKFHLIELLRQKVEEKAEEVMNQRKNTQHSSLLAAEQDLEQLQEQLEAAEQEILHSLSQTVKAVSTEIDTNLNILARLDTIFAKAAFGTFVDAQIPTVGQEGCILVDQFVHPVLLLAEEGSHEVVPIDLRLSAQEGQRALIVSGPNGGGKTGAMKSFGLSATLCRLGIPIPCATTTSNGANQGPRVDFFEKVHVALGDQQSLTEGESTMMARLNACSVVINSVCQNTSGGKMGAATTTSMSSLVLLDEIGGGTDPNAGGAIAQAVLEKLLEVDTCRIVATTHVPRLKVLSYQSPHFGCATVLLEPLGDSDCGDKTIQQYQQPAFELLYNSIGDSYALGAASRCKPSFPDDVIARATQLMTTTSTTANERLSENSADDVSLNTDAAYLQVLTQSIQKQSQKAREARALAEQHVEDLARCRKAMLSLAASYDRQFALLEQKLESTYTKLNDDKTGSLEITGKTLKELRLVRKKVQSESEQLKEQGLKLLPDGYDLKEGESVVIVSEDEWNGVSGTASQKDLSQRSLKIDDVAVMPTFYLGEDTMALIDSSADVSGDQPEKKKPLILKRSQIAIWDYDSVWGDFDESLSDNFSATGVKESKRRLNDVLSSLKTSSSKSPTEDAKSMPSKTFSSSRERKAAKKGSKSKGKQQQRKRRQ